MRLSESAVSLSKAAEVIFWVPAANSPPRYRISNPLQTCTDDNSYTRNTVLAILHCQKHPKWLFISKQNLQPSIRNLRNPPLLKDSVGGLM